ncbi:MAG: tetratricopeptide repeat protein, partial [Bacteroidota bacterium]
EYVVYRLKVAEVALYNDRPEKDYKAAAKAYSALATYYKNNNDFDACKKYKLLAAEAAIHPECPVEKRDYHSAAWSYGSLAELFNKKDQEKYETYKLLAAEAAIHPECPGDKRDYRSAAWSYGSLAESFKEIDQKQYEKYKLLSAKTDIHPECPVDKRDYRSAALSYKDLVRVLRESNSSQVTQTINDITVFLDSYEHSPKGYSLLGNFYRTIRYFDKALEYIKAAEKLQPHTSRDKYYKGLVYWDMGNYAAAKESFQEAVRLDTEYKEYERALNEVNMTLSMIEKFRQQQQQSSSDEEKVNAATMLLEREQTALLEKLDAIVAAYDNDKPVINRSVFRPYRDGVEELRSDTQTDKFLPFSLEGFVAGQVSSQRD